RLDGRLDHRQPARQPLRQRDPPRRHVHALAQLGLLVAQLVLHLLLGAAVDRDAAALALGVVPAETFASHTPSARWLIEPSPRPLLFLAIAFILLSFR